MLILPAVDLLDGKAVRLYQGDYHKVSTYDQDPVAAACRLEEAGVARIHVVDLDAARNQGRNNREVIKAIRKAVACQIEVGGGIRSISDVEELISIGVDWLIIGTALIKQPAEVAKWIEQYPGRFIAGIDAKDGVVKIAGWEDDAGFMDIEIAKKAAGMGFSGIIYTNISRDGTLAGPDLERTNAVAAASGISVYLSGGIGSMADFEHAHKFGHPLVHGIITGKALYEGALNLSELCRTYLQYPI